MSLVHVNQENKPSKCSLLSVIYITTIVLIRYFAKKFFLPTKCLVWREKNGGCSSRLRSVKRWGEEYLSA